MTQEHGKAEGDRNRDEKAETRTHLPFKGVDDELQLKRIDTLNTLLHHMVAICILDPFGKT